MLRTRLHCLKQLLCLVPLICWVSPAAAQGAGEARELALEALRLEFGQDNVSATAEELDAQFAEACEKGYNPACRRSAWLTDGRPDVDETFDVFQPSCEAGDPVACLVVGWSLDKLALRAPTEEDRTQTFRKAAKLFQSHCDDGFTPACHSYATFLYENKGVVVDPRAALNRWGKACDAGEYASCTQLARLHRDGGPAVKVNRNQAISYASKACTGGYSDGCFVLGEMQDVTWTQKELDAEYGRLCDAGHQDSCWRLARVYFDGIHQEPSQGRILGLFDRACQLGHARACFEAGRWQQDSGGDHAKSAALYGRACDLGDSAGCSAQVSMILSGKAEGTVRDAYEAFDVACEQRQSLEACTELAYALISGVQVPRDAERGRALLSRACTDQDSSSEACFQLAQAYEEGVGGPRDRPTAGKYYRWSCTSGSVDACMRRGQLLYLDGSSRQRDDHEALAMFQRACQGEMAEGCLFAGEILDEGTNVRADGSQAAALYETGCTLGSPASCTALGALHERGSNGTPDMTAARAAYDSALALDSLDAKRSLARLLWNGFGGKKDRGRAKSLCREACQSGDAVACRGPQFL